jgi:hypothetical protein
MAGFVIMTSPAPLMYRTQVFTYKADSSEEAKHAPDYDFPANHSYQRNDMPRNDTLSGFATVSSRGKLVTTYDFF